MTSPSDEPSGLKASNETQHVEAGGERTGSLSPLPADDARTIPLPAVPGESVCEPDTPSRAGPVDETTITFLSSEHSFEAGLEVNAAGRRTFGDYELIEPIARGGMGVVYKAEQKKLQRLVALKMILSGQLASEEEIKRFYTEAEAAAQLDHPGIVPIYEVGDFEGQHYFSMAFVEGGTLATRVREGPLPPQQAARLVKQVAEAVAYAHDLGIIHRDLKPGNILLDKQGHPNVSDFGLAKRVKGISHLTVAGQILGTPSYMPPEQASGLGVEVGPLADVYSLGAILYCLLTGRPPFHSAHVMDTLRQVLEQEPVSPRQLNGAVSRDLDTICLKCLQKDASRRYPSALALAEDLARFLAGEPILARPIGKAERCWRWCKRKPLVASLAAGVTLSLLLGISFSTYFGVQARNEAKVARENEEAAKAARRLSDERRYVSEFRLAFRTWQDGNTDLVRQYLDQLAPASEDSDDLRGFEWYYLQRLCHLELQALPRETASVLGVAFSPDGTLLASCGVDKTVKIWDCPTWRVLRTLTGHSEMVLSVAYSPDGRLLASASADKTVRLWDALTGESKFTLEGHTDAVRCVAFDPKGHRLASCSRDKTVKIWNVDTGKSQRTLEGHTETVWGVAFSPSGLLASCGDEKTIKLWDLESGKPPRNLDAHQAPVHKVTFSQDSGLLASASDDGTVRLWNTATWQQAAILSGHASGVECVTFSPDGQHIASGGADRITKIWNTQTSREILSLRGNDGPVFGVAFSPDGRRIASASASNLDASLKIWDALVSQEETVLRGHTGLVESIAFSSDGRCVVSGSFDHTIKLWDVTTGQTTRTLRGHTAPVTAVAVSPDGRLLASGSQDHTVRLWDAASGEEKALLRGHTGEIFSIAFSPDGLLAASSSFDKTVKIWDVNLGVERRTLLGLNDWVRCVRFSPDGQQLAAAGHDSKIRFWHVDTGELLRTWDLGAENAGESIAFSPDGELLAVAADDPVVTVWSVREGQVVKVLRGHIATSRSIAFSPDGKRIATASWDRTVKIWDVATCQETLTLQANGKPVHAVVFSRDGLRLAAANSEHDVWIWDATALTPERRDEREAVSVARYWLGKSLPHSEVVQKIRADMTISDAIRQRALSLALDIPKERGSP
jgi:WD40 repeat protein/tRNA A-37 threonylcarbamoyl transferase component Bud32